MRRSRETSDLGAPEVPRQTFHACLRTTATSARQNQASGSVRVVSAFRRVLSKKARETILTERLLIRFPAVRVVFAEPFIRSLDQAPTCSGAAANDVVSPSSPSSRITKSSTLAPMLKFVSWRMGCPLIRTA